MKLDLQQLLRLRCSRRALFGAALGSSLANLPVVASATSATTVIDLVTKKIPILNLPRAFDGYRIGFLTDPHIGVNVPFEWLEEALVKIRDAKIDLLLLGGDYISINDSALSQSLQVDRNPALRGHPPSAYPDLIYFGIAELISKFKAKDGTFGVLGNHDCWVNPDLCKRAFTKYGMRILVNELVEIKRANSTLQIFGTDDYWNGRPNLKALHSLSEHGNTARIMLTHNPDYISLLLRTQVVRFGLSLSGHTHGGQIKIPGLGALSYNIQDLRLAEGLYTAPNGAQCYTSRGIGLVELPFRLNCPSEATILELIAP